MAVEATGATRLLVVTPLADEAEALLDGLRALGHETQNTRVGRLGCVDVRDLGLLVGVGGHGKAQFAVQAQHLLDSVHDVCGLLCAGASGALASDLEAGDVVLGTETVEHDFQLKFSARPLPRHPADATLLRTLGRVATAGSFPFAIAVGQIASGDEDVVSRGRAAEIREAIGAIAVAWEGAGGARAAAFSDVPFLETRVITDAAGESAPLDFHESLHLVMPNLATLLSAWRAPR